MGRNEHTMTKQIQVQETWVASFTATFPPEILPHLTFSCSDQEAESPTDYLGLRFTVGQPPAISSPAPMPWEADCGHLSHTPWTFPLKA